MYPHVADHHSVLHTQGMACSVREALYVLDGLLNNDPVLRPKAHWVDQHGFPDQRLGLWHLVGFALMPRLKVSQQRRYKLDRTQQDGDLDEVIRGTVATARIREQWAQRVRLAASRRHRTAPAPVVLRRFASRAPADRLAKALTAWGGALRSLYRLRSIHEEALRGRRQLPLHRGDGRHQRARRRFFANQGALQTGDDEEIRNKATCLSLLANAVVVGNPMQMARLRAQLRAHGETITHEDLARVSPVACSQVIPQGPYFRPPTVRERDRSHHGHTGAVDSDRADNR